MKLSVVIVNYNVRYFLEQCLYAVFNSLKSIEGEVVVVDNCSVDGSVSMVKQRFPKVTLIENDQNLGFACANNIGIRASAGEYVLILNPDTVIEETSLSKCIHFMDSHPEAGALGPRMIDGKGRFLPESKRGLPTPSVAFYKMFGFTRLFPQSRRFGAYYLGHLSPDATHQVDVLTGAFMFVRRSVFAKSGLFDEQYFMYGEDIDLSYSILKAGYKNYYFPETSIIHYKGESTRKGSLNYVVMFYKAMQLFARKHFSGRFIQTYLLLINLAIYFRAGISVLKRTILKGFPILLDAFVIYWGCYSIANWWAVFQFHQTGYYTGGYFGLGLPVSIVIWLSAVFISGGYRSPFNLNKLSKGLLFGTVAILIIYALLPLQYRFSRALILFGTGWSLLSTAFVHYILSLTGIKEFRLDLKRKRRIAIVGKEDETERVKKLLKMSGIVTGQMVKVAPDFQQVSEEYAGSLHQLKEIIEVHHIDEVVFCARDVNSQDIISNMKSLAYSRVEFKIASPNSPSVIGSNSSNSSGDMYVINIDIKAQD